VKAAAAWVALEWARGVLMSGFPWNFLGVSQWRQAPLIQVASYTGVYGVSFIMVWFSLGLVGGLATVLGRPDRRLGWMTDLRWPVLALCGVLAWGFYKVLDDRRVEVGEEGRWLTLGLVQPSIRQTLMWDPEAGEASFLVAERLSQQALALGIDVLVWPEGSFGLSGTNFHQMRRQIRDAGVSWIFGSDGYDETEEGKPLVFNSAYMVGPGGQVEARYDKCRLVIFGEYVPLERWLPFLRWLTPIGSSFAVGSGPVPFRSKDGAWEISPVICFEDIFPRATSRHVMEETDLLLELTNDGWFGESSAQWQHAANAAFRAVENGVPLVRCTNNGLTGWLDGSGLVREWLGGSGAAVHASGFLRVRIPLRDAAWRPTFYRQWGDWFPVLCLVVTIIALRIGDARGARNSPDQERRLR
jgi:apolipoprotein N-acyltransferase